MQYTPDHMSAIEQIKAQQNARRHGVVLTEREILMAGERLIDEQDRHGHIQHSSQYYYQKLH